ncbi:MAG: SpoIID/LytB domain-containing protein [Bacillota bacterium]
MKYRHSIALVSLLIITMALGGCFQARRPVPNQPAPQAQPKGQVPTIPKQISKGAGVEPELTVYIKETGETKKMKMEDYIMGVVAGEMEPDWPVNALAAQAILARTFTLQKIAKEGGVPNRKADASTDIEEFQAYNASRISDKVRQAVQQTRGVIASYQGEFIRAWFHADSGGKTATAEEGLSFTKEPTPYVVPVTDEEFRKGIPADKARFTASFSTAEVAKAASSTGAKVSSVKSMKIAERGPSGRVTAFTVDGQRVPAAAFRIAIGSTELKSLMLDGDPVVSGGKVTFKGKGYGHGVGMAQWGAKGMAEAGKSPEAIVRFYFKDVEIHQIYK